MISRPEFERLLELSTQGEQEELSPTGCLEFLSGLGLIRQKGLPLEWEKEFREMEKQLRRHLDFYLERLETFHHSSEQKSEKGMISDQPGTLPLVLLEHAEKLLSESPFVEAITEFLNVRDQWERVWEVLEEVIREYAQEKGQWIGALRNCLDEVDEKLIFRTSLSQELCRLGSNFGYSASDRDRFWWTNREVSCPIPLERRNYYLTGYVEGRWKGNLKRDIGTHLKECTTCFQVYESVREILLQNLLEYFAPPTTFAAAGQDELPPTRVLIWRDRNEKWEVRLYASGDSLDEELYLSLQREAETDLNKISLIVGEEKLSFDKEGLVHTKRADLYNHLVNEHGLLHLSLSSLPSEQIELYYLGER